MKYLSVLLLFVLCLVTCFSCKDRQYQQEEACVADFLAQSGMIPYTGEVWSDCRFFVNLYEYDNGFYFMMNNYCVDLAANPLDCNGEPLCELGNMENCAVFDNDIHIGIVGLEEL